MNKLSAKSDNQLEYIRTIKRNVVTLCIGPAGVGKSTIACFLAVEALKKNLVGKIVITRPLVQCEEELGHLKGSLEDKVDPYMVPLWTEIEKWTSPQELKEWKLKKLIECVPISLMRGYNFVNSFVLVDEAQNASYSQLKMVLTRIGENSKLVIVGDPDQSDVEDDDFIRIYEKLKNIVGIGLCELKESDIVRSPLISSILKALR